MALQSIGQKRKGLHTKNPSLTQEDASAFARLPPGKRAEVRETRRLLEKRSQKLMKRSALLKHDIDTFQSELATLGIHNYLHGVAHVCECSPLCPAVWSSLSVDLLQLVFSRLPLPDIIRLRVLSKIWDRHVTGVTPGFTNLCAERNPNLFALVRDESEYDVAELGCISIKLYDCEGKKWHRFLHETRVPKNKKMFAGDGGLVCLVSPTQDQELEVAVLNPLTRQCRQLPPLSSQSRIRRCMVQLVMDRDSNCYKVLVVDHKKRSGGVVSASIFSSATGRWRQANTFSDVFFGYQYVWEKNGPNGQFAPKQESDPCAYHCGSSKLLELTDESYPCKTWDERVLVKDRLIVLHMNDDDDQPPSPLYQGLLSIYQAQMQQPHWSRRKMLRSCELDEVCDVYGDLDTRLWGCQDFLLLLAFEILEDNYFHKRTFLFDLSTKKWQTISKFPKWRPAHPASAMFDLRWDAVP